MKQLACCDTMSLVEVNHLGPRLRRYVDEECCCKRHPRLLTDIANLALEEGRLVWTALGKAFVYGIRLPSAEGFQPFYYVHVRHWTNRSKSRNLYIHATCVENALMCLEYLLRLDLEACEYISISCLHSKTNSILPTTHSRMPLETKVNHPCRRYALPAQLLQKVVQLYPQRWMVFNNLKIDNDSSQTLACLPVRLSLSKCKFDDGGVSFIRAFVESGRRLRAIRLHESPFQWDEFFSEFLGLCGQSRDLETIELMAPMPYQGILEGLSHAVRQSKSIRSLHLGWPRDRAPDKERLVKPSKKNGKATDPKWVLLTRAIIANQSLRELSLDVLPSTQHTVSEQSYAARIFLTIEVAKMLKVNPRIQHVPFQSQLFDWQIWKALVAPVLQGEYHRRLIESLHHQDADDVRAALVGRVVSQLVAPNPGLVYKCLELHTDIVVHYL